MCFIILKVNPRKKVSGTVSETTEATSFSRVLAYIEGQTCLQ